MQHRPTAGWTLLGELHAMSRRSRFYFLGSVGWRPFADLSPQADPVQMVVSYSRTGRAGQQALVFVPGAGLQRESDSPL